MGNNNSVQNFNEEKETFEDIINKIAAKVIKNQNFQQMINLSNADYCNNIIILTSEIFKQYLNEETIEYLALKKGIKGENIIKKDKVIAITKKRLEELNSLGVSDPLKKERLCIGVAKHYIQIAHIFAAIASSLNPVNYIDNTSKLNLDNSLESNNNIQEDFLPIENSENTIENSENKEENSENPLIPKDIFSIKGGEPVSNILNFSDGKTENNKQNIPSFDNLCSQRIKILLNGIKYKDLANISNVDQLVKLFTINPSFCTLNSDGRTLINEPGIPELNTLYYDKYDYESGEFTGMSENMKKIYQEDVDILYKEFSGNKSIPLDPITGLPTITKFSEIPLKDFHESEGCKSGKYEEAIDPINDSDSVLEVASKKRLFNEYAMIIKKMWNEIQSINDELLKILDNIFIFKKEENSKENKEENEIIYINPNLDNKKLIELTKATKKNLIKLYSSCEMNFIEGLKIYEKLVKKQSFHTIKSQINNLKETLNSSKDEDSNKNTIEDSSKDEDSNENTIEDSLKDEDSNKNTIEDSSKDEDSNENTIENKKDNDEDNNFKTDFSLKHLNSDESKISTLSNNNSDIESSNKENTQLNNSLDLKTDIQMGENNFQDTLNTLKDSTIKNVNTLKDSTINNINKTKDQIMDTLGTTLNTAKEKALSTLNETKDNVKSSIDNALNTAKDETMKQLSNTKAEFQNVSETTESKVKNVAETTESQLKNIAENTESKVKNVAETTESQLKNVGENSENKLKTSVQEIKNESKKNITNAINKIKTFGGSKKKKIIRKKLTKNKKLKN